MQTFGWLGTANTLFKNRLKIEVGLLVQKQSVNLYCRLGFLSLAYSAFSPTDTSNARTVTQFSAQRQQVLALHWCKKVLCFFLMLYLWVLMLAVSLIC